MKRTIKTLGIFALLVIIGFAVMGCDTGNSDEDNNNNNGTVTLIDGGSTIYGEWLSGSSHVFLLTTGMSWAGDIVFSSWEQKSASDNSYEVLLMYVSNSLWETVTYVLTDSSTMNITGAVKANGNASAFAPLVGQTLTKKP